MEDLETHKARRIEQMVAKWLRRSRDNSARGRASLSDGPYDGSYQPASHVKLTMEIRKDLLRGHYGFEISHHLPLLITSVVAGSAAEGKLLPGDRILAINNDTAEGITVEQAASLLRESQDSLQFTVLRCTSGGHKSSFLTAEKRARLKSNPVKVRFAEEVVVNGPTQGSSLLCMPNVLKVYLENGQTKAFKFEANTTVKDIILTLKEKLSLQSIEHFALVLEEQYNVLKIHLLHEDEFIDQVVQRKESHNYRCLFRVCFIPRDPLHLLQQDPVAFEYLYLQSCSDVLQERFAVEMKCSVALRLAALHIQERIITCAQPQKVSLKYIEKDWGIENFISPTLLRNMRGKDIKKAISFHMKRNQLLLDPRQKHLLSAAQVQLCYLQILGDLKLYGGKIFNATLMLQDRESCIALLVGAKYGISQVVNNKLNIITVLAEFANISRLELTEESDKVSMVKIYLQDIQMLTVLLESNSAKDLACLISGYYRMFVDSSSSIFIWGERKPQIHRFSAEEGYESRICSDSEESSEPESSLDHFSDVQSPKHSRIGPRIKEEDEQQGLEQERKTLQAQEMTLCNGYHQNDSLSEASDSANTESRGLKSSGSSDSLDALEEDDLETCSAGRPDVLQFCTPDFQQLAGSDKLLFGANGEEESRTAQENFFSFLLPPHVSSPGLPHPEAESKRESDMGALESRLAEGNIMEYYSLCANISPASSGGRNTLNDSSESCSLQDTEDQESHVHTFALQHSLSSENTNSDDEFYDAAEKMTTTGPGDLSLNSSPELPTADSLGENILSRQSRKTKPRAPSEPRCANNIRKRRSFLQTNYTSQVTFPIASPHALKNSGRVSCSRESAISGASCSPEVTSLREPQQVPSLLEAKEHIQMAKKSASSTDVEEISSVAQGSSEATTESPEKETLNHKVNIISTGTSPGVSYVLIEEIIHTTTKPSWSDGSIQIKPLSYTALLDRDPLPAEMVEEQEQHVLGPCKRLKDDPVQCESSRALEGSVHEESVNHMINKEITQKSEEEKHLISNGTELFFSFDDDLRLETQVSCPDYGSVVDYEEMSQETDSKFQNDVNNFTLKDGVLRPISPNLSAMSTSPNVYLSNDFASNSKTEVKNLARNSHKDKMPISSKASTKDNLKHSKADDSNGLGYISCDILCQAGKFSEKNSVSKPSLLSSDNVAGDEVAFNNTGPPALVNSQRTFSPRYKPERCSCQFPYASCFHELDNEAELDCISPIASSISAGPLTTPPSTRNSLPLHLNPTRHRQEHNCTNGTPKDSQQHTHLPESPLKALHNMKEKMSALPFDFCHLLDNVVELQEMLRRFGGSQIEHPQDKCFAQFLGSKNALHVVSQRLLSNCQRVIRSHGPSLETQTVIQETFQNLLQLTEACFQFTNCDLCSSRHTELKSNLADVLCSYQQFVHVSRQAYEMGYSSLSVKLLVCQYTALTASLLCLVQQYKGSSCTL